MRGVRQGNQAELWRDPRLGFDVHDDGDEGERGDAADLLGAKLITAATIARVLDSPCAACRRAERAGKPRLNCRNIGCDRWSSRRARRWLRRSQCPQRPGDPPCAARSGGSCACQVGFRLSAAGGGAWCTTMARLRDRVPDICDLVLMSQSDEEQ